MAILGDVDTLPPSLDCVRVFSQGDVRIFKFSLFSRGKYFKFSVALNNYATKPESNFFETGAVLH